MKKATCSPQVCFPPVFHLCSSKKFLLVVITECWATPSSFVTVARSYTRFFREEQSRLDRRSFHCNTVHPFTTKNHLS